MLAGFLCFLSDVHSLAHEPTSQPFNSVAKGLEPDVSVCCLRAEDVCGCASGAWHCCVCLGVHCGTTAAGMAVNERSGSARRCDTLQQSKQRARNTTPVNTVNQWQRLIQSAFCTACTYPGRPHRGVYEHRDRRRGGRMYEKQTACTEWNARWAVQRRLMIVEIRINESSVRRLHKQKHVYAQVWTSL